MHITIIRSIPERNTVRTWLFSYFLRYQALMSAIMPSSDVIGTPLYNKRSLSWSFQGEDSGDVINRLSGCLCLFL